MVPVSIDGSVAIPAVVDISASSSIINARAASLAGLMLDRSGTRVGAWSVVINTLLTRAATQPLR